MKVTNIVNIDLSIRQNIPFVDAVQGDSARAIEFRLFDKGQPFNVPDDSAVLIRYKRPDGFGGVYDTLPNGETAYSISSNKVTVVLSPTALGAPGEVDFQISILNGNDLISIFSIQIRVDADPYIDSSEAEDYVNITGVSSNEIAISSTAPTDDKVKLWINPDEAEEDEGGDSTLLVVTFTTDENGKHTPSHTYDQIKEWLDNGGSAVLTNGNQWYNLAFMNASTVWFERTVAMSTGTMYVRYVITAMGQMTKTEDNHKLVNVTAEVGQTIIVKEVDEKGKPTKWEAAEYPLTDTEIIPQTTYTATYDSIYGCYMYELQNNHRFVVGKKYAVLFDGVEYACTANVATVGTMTATYIGNGVLAGDNTGEPFVLMSIVGIPDIMIAGFDGNEHTVHVRDTNLHDTYVPQSAYPYYIEVTGSGTDEDPYVCNETVTSIVSILNSGRLLFLKLYTTGRSSYNIYYPSSFGADYTGFILNFTQSYNYGGGGDALNRTITVLSQSDGTLMLSKF